MSLPSLLRKWVHLPSRIALLLGVGALSATGAEAAVAEAHLSNGLTRVPQQSAKSFGELRIWSENGRIYFSEAGKDPQELCLVDTAEARRLKQLLEREGAVAASPSVLHNRIILVGGGGDGFHWAPAGKAGNSEKLKVPAKTVSSSKEAAPRAVNPPGSTAAPSKTRASEVENRK
jgi:hypothetical protein